MKVAFWITGASQSPARKPMTTDGSAAITSTTGFTNAFTLGGAKADV